MKNFLLFKVYGNSRLLYNYNILVTYDYIVQLTYMNLTFID